MQKLMLLLLFFPAFLPAQNTLRAIVKDRETKEKLIGATAYIKKLKLGTSTDTSGSLVLTGIPEGEYEIIFSYTAYEKKEVELVFPLKNQEPVEVLLKNESGELAEVVVTSTRTNSRIEDIPIRVEVIGEEEVDEEGSVKPANVSKLLTESPSIQAQQLSATNGSVSIRLQGLDGKYTQILKDGFPLYGGFAQGLSIVQIPPLDLKQVEIIKGSSSSLYGSDAIAGIVNLISKQPKEKRDLTFLVNQTSLLGTNADAYFSQRWKKTGFSLLGTSNFQRAVDVNRDNFSDLPKTQTFNIAPAFYYYIDSTSTLRLSLNGTMDKRIGGDMQVLNKQADSLHRYFEDNVSNRLSSQLKYDKQFAKDKSFSFKNSVSYFDRSIVQAVSAFSGKQTGTYTEAAFNCKIAAHQLVSGLNFISEKFSEDSSKSHLHRNYNYTTLGLFVQDDWKPAEKLALQAGLRGDYQNQYGLFILPRLALLYKFTKDFYIRAGSGLGYKVPGLFSTASELAGISNIQPLPPNIKAEKSIGSNLDVNYKLRIGDDASITLNQSFFTTQINDPLVPDSFTFVNKSKGILTRGFESNVRYRLDEFQIFAAYSYIDARRLYNSQQSVVPLTPRHKLNFDVIFEEEENYVVALEAFYISSMLRDADTKTKAYCTFGFIVQKHIQQITLIAGCENIFDTRQSRFENMVVSPGPAPHFRQVYAPLDGRVLNVALRIKV